ncbi:MAG: thioredoxin family protein [Planctomycetaceae bacterium]|nr:thioredoxin family protein [Planctomycetaceae bacterium]
MSLISASVLLLAVSTTYGQNLGDDLFPGFSTEFSDGAEQSKATLTATLSPVAGEDASSLSAGDEVVLSLKLDISPGGYTYSTSRKFAGATTIVVTEISGLEPLGEEFTADHNPKVQFEESFGQEIEKFTGNVTWSRRFKLTGEVPADRAYVAGELNFQVCDASSCTPMTESFDTVIAAGKTLTESPEATKTTSLEYGYLVRPTRTNANTPDPLTLQFEMQPTDAQPGDTVTVAVTMSLEDDWHTFGLIPHEQQISNPTELFLDELTNLRPVTEEFEPTHPPETIEQEIEDSSITEHVHHDTVTWTQTFEVIEPGPYGVAGEIEYQICKTSCMPPKAVPFALGSLQVPGHIAAASTITSSNITLEQSAEELADAPVVEADDAVDDESANETKEAGLAWYLLLAFGGGLILNVMPCVLPVLAIKLMSFVQQAGESRGRVLLLNICYSLGVIGVFLVLATLAVTLKMGWGGLFQKPEFNLVMIAIVFTMGLSMLGVFEIPIPGMVGSAGGQHREGLMGAFITGIFATLLATPCSGPFMGSALAWSVKQSAPVVFLVWGVMGLGMASPYLMVGIFPSSIRLLPKPGMWMVRFKEFSGFALMGATIWIIYSLKAEAILPTLIFLLGLAIAVWMIGTLYDYSSTSQKKMAVRGSALVILLLISGFAWDQYRSANRPTLWEPFSGARVAELRKEGRPILIDFTATWCAICQTNKKYALKTEPTTEFLKEHNVAALVADYTHPDPEIKEWLDRYDSISLPLYLIFPPEPNADPVVFDGLVTQARIIDKLNEALSMSKTAAATESSQRHSSVAQQ